MSVISIPIRPAGIMRPLEKEKVNQKLVKDK